MSSAEQDMQEFKQMIKDLDWKYQDVADRSGLTVGTIKVRLSQGAPSWMRLALAVYKTTKRKCNSNLEQKVKEILENYEKHEEVQESN